MMIIKCIIYKLGFFSKSYSTFFIIIIVTIKTIFIVKNYFVEHLRQI